jgi:hypothetical protein
MCATARAIVVAGWQNYCKIDDPHVAAIDTFLVFLLLTLPLVSTHALTEPYPLNAFLASCFAAIGQAVLLVSLRVQLRPSRSKQDSSLAATGSAVAAPPPPPHEAAFVHFVCASICLHFVAFILTG